MKSGKSLWLKKTKNRQPWNVNKCHMTFLSVFCFASWLLHFCLIHTPLIIVSTCPLWSASLCHLCVDLMSHYSLFVSILCKSITCLVFTLPFLFFWPGFLSLVLVFWYLLFLTFGHLFGFENSLQKFIVAACALSPALICTIMHGKT